MFKQAEIEWDFIDPTGVCLKCMIVCHQRGTVQWRCGYVRVPEGAETVHIPSCRWKITYNHGGLIGFQLLSPMIESMDVFMSEVETMASLIIKHMPPIIILSLVNTIA